MTRLLLVLILVVVPVTAWPADAGPPHRTHVAIGTLSGMPVGAVTGVLLWAVVAESATCQGNDIECGVGPLVRALVLGGPIGVAWGAVVGGTLAGVATKSPRLVRTVLWGGSFALAGSVLLAVPLNIGTVGAGWALTLVATPMAMIALTPARGGEGVSVAPMPMRGGAGARVSLAW